ncbi:hypothetical protein QR680_011998 [Steinernema hermaphroditum]|uniref:C2H2-type domain-containing protein n=1 Tax=Steinernema hermaphroditum TaxID=289476 RepID=A0AA39LZR3_9BILA|nr:hypothetical protein QR680_011998 [Steinernema hermaphroditum]
MTDLGSAAFPANGSPHRLDGGTEEEVIGEPAALQCQACSAKVCEWDQKDVDKHIASHTENPCACFFRGCDRTFQCPLTFRVHVLKKHGLAPDQLAPELRTILAHQSQGCKVNLQTRGIRDFLEHLAVHENIFYECAAEGCEKRFRTHPELHEHLTACHELTASTFSEQIVDSFRNRTVLKLGKYFDEEKEVGADKNMTSVGVVGIKEDSDEIVVIKVVPAVSFKEHVKEERNISNPSESQHCAIQITAHADARPAREKSYEIVDSSDENQMGVANCNADDDVVVAKEEPNDVVLISSVNAEHQLASAADGTTSATAFRAGIWQCQQCKKNVNARSKRDLLQHVGTHEHNIEEIHCFVEGCQFTSKCLKCLRGHLNQKHGLSAEDLKSSQYQELVDLERTFRQKMEDHLDKYFPARAFVSKMEVGNTLKPEVSGRPLTGLHQQVLLRDMRARGQILCPCIVEGCTRRRYFTPERLKIHLKNLHNLRPDDLNDEQRKRLLEVERNFFRDMKDAFDRHFPPEVKKEPTNDTNKAM